MNVSLSVPKFVMTGNTISSSEILPYCFIIDKYSLFNEKNKEQAGAELYQAKAKLG